MKYFARILILIPLVFSACSQKTEHADGGSLISGGVISPTIYYFPQYTSEDLNCADENKVQLRTQNDDVILVACDDIADNCALQGTCSIQTDQEKMGLAYDGVRDGSKRFRVTDFNGCEFSQGVKNLCLTPFYSVAADLNFYDVGEVLYIPDIEGIQLPDGTFHSGYFVVEDTGSKIVGENRFDFFTGTLNHHDENNPFAKLGLSDKLQSLQFYKVIGARAELVKNRLISQKYK